MHNLFFSSMISKYPFIWVVFLVLSTSIACHWINKPVEDVFQLAKNADTMLLLNPEDPADEQINQTMFLFAASLCRSLNQPDDIRFLLQDVPFNTYGEWALTSDSLLNSRFGLSSQYQAVAKANQWSESTFDRFNDMKYKGVPYQLCLVCYNPKAMATPNEIIIAMGESVGENDQIPGWKIQLDTKKPEYMPVLVSEADSSSNTPIFIVSIASREPEKQKYLNGLSDAEIQKSGLASAAPNRTWIPSEYQIDLRYERNGKSDYCQNHRIFYNNGSFSSTTTDGYLIDRIAEEHIGKRFYASTSFPATGNGYWFVTYEKDWYAARKGIFVGSTNGAPTWVYVHCKMKYVHEFYQTMVLNFANQSPQTAHQKGILKVLCQ